MDVKLQFRYHFYLLQLSLLCGFISNRLKRLVEHIANQRMSSKIYALRSFGQCAPQLPYDLFSCSYQFFSIRKRKYTICIQFSPRIWAKNTKNRTKKWNNAYTLTDHSFIFIILPFKAQKIHGSSKSGTKKNLNLHENSSESTRDIYLMCLARLANWSRYIIPYRSYKVREYSARSVSIHRIILIYVC